MLLQNSRRRSNAIFYPLEMPLRYKMENQTTGHGLTTELNGEVVRFKCDYHLPAGQNVQLIVTWPISLSDGTPLNLWINGSVIGTYLCEIEVGVGRYEFRTRRLIQTERSHPLEPAISR